MRLSLKVSLESVHLEQSDLSLLALIIKILFQILQQFEPGIHTAVKLT